MTDEKSDEKTDDAEKAYWDRNKTELKGVLNEWFEDKRKELAASSTNRNGGRATLPSILANFVFGPADK
jgi:hypothetical protein